MEKCAFLIPIYPPHFKYARDLIKSWQECFLDEQSDIWFVFTNEEEKAEFGDWTNSVVLPENLSNHENNGIINIKKFYGLSQIKDDYEYIIVLDSESKFIRNINLEELCDSYFNNKTLYGNSQPPEGLEKTEGIKNSCKRFFQGHKDFEKINNPLYLWFNQPCIYKTSTLNEFFEVIDYHNNASKFLWTDFDYYIYMFYLILYHDFKIEDIEITSNYGICEAGLDFLFFKSNKYEKINIYMVSQAVFKRFDNPKLFILIHLDRDERWMLSVFGIKVDNLIQEMKRLNSDNVQLKNNLEDLTIKQNNVINQLKEENSRLKQREIEIQQQMSFWEIRLNKMKFKYKLRKFLSCFIPNKKIRRKMRGEND